MNVKQLKEAISNLPDDMEVIIKKDSEGNDYSPLSGIDDESVYIPENTYSGEAYWTGWTADEAGKTDEEWEELKSKPRVLLLCPIN